MPAEKNCKMHLTGPRPRGQPQPRRNSRYAKPSFRPCCRRMLALIGVLASAGTEAGPWNDPYPTVDDRHNSLYLSFAERPKHLDPAQSYSEEEAAITQQIYEPLLQYHFLRRPYELIPLTATTVPTPRYLDTQGRTLPADAAVAAIAQSVYRITLQPGIRFQPHPAFAQQQNGTYCYHALRANDLDTIRDLTDFKATATRELTAADYVYEVKRLAHPKLQSPIVGFMSEHIVGLDDLMQRLSSAQTALETRQGTRAFVDPREFDFDGARVIDRYTFELRIKGKYPQFVYWVSMPFFAPVPWEADQFYRQPGLTERNISLDWFPIGTGPYQLVENNPNRRMVLERNPNFRGEAYPSDGSPEAIRSGMLADAGQTMPFIDRVVYSLEQESIPGWTKFLQGYYDISGVSSDNFDQALQFGSGGQIALTAEMEAKGMRLLAAVRPSNYYLGFNMRDAIVGGRGERERLLRLAISIAIDYEEFISIFANGRGIAAQGALPPGILGYRDDAAGINPLVYDWVHGKPRRKDIAEAKALLAKAGYPEGRDVQNGQPLVLNYDTAQTGPDAKPRLDWYRKQFDKLGVQLVIRASDYNRFQDKMRTGTSQIFEWGWNADYPDPENFLFLLYGPNGKVEKQGENAANYSNPEFDRLFEQMRDMDNGPARLALIDRLQAIARHDAPWAWGWFPLSYTLHHAWYKNPEPNLMARNTIKYRRIDVSARAAQRLAWNTPILWPIGVVVCVFLALLLPVVVSYRRKERLAAL
jgi:oligopeptide transport system substrate-binding protein